MTSKRTYAKTHLPGLLLPVPRPCGRLLQTHASAGDLQTLTGRSDSVSCRVTAPFFWVLGHKRFLFVPSKSRVFGFPSHVEKSYNQILLAFKVRFLGDTWSLCWTLRLRSLMWGSKSSQQWGAPLVLLFSSLWVAHPADMGFDFIGIMSFLYLLWLLLCLWMRCSILLSIVAQQLVVIF